MRRPALRDDQSRNEAASDPRHVTPSRTVVVGYDGSQAARRALDRAAEAAGRGGHVVVVTAAPPADELALDTAPDRAVADPPRLLEEAAAILESHDVEVSTRVEKAEPAEALAETARHLNAGLIVVGARGDSYLARALRGSVGEKLVSRAPCDLLVAR